MLSDFFLNYMYIFKIINKKLNFCVRSTFITKPGEEEEEEEVLNMIRGYM